jgi:hypothetical protein
MDILTGFFFGVVTVLLFRIGSTLNTLKDRSYVIQNEIREAANKKNVWHQETPHKEQPKKAHPK